MRISTNSVTIMRTEQRHPQDEQQQQEQRRPQQRKQKRQRDYYFLKTATATNVLLTILVVVVDTGFVVTEASSFYRRHHPALLTKQQHWEKSRVLQKQQSHYLLQRIRGGSTNTEDDADDEEFFDAKEEEEGDEDEDEEDEDEDDEDEDEMEEEEGGGTSTPEPIPEIAEPVTIRIKTNLGNKLLDQYFDLMVARTRNVLSLKKNLSRQLPGRPPISTLSLLYRGQRITDEKTLVTELLLEEEEEEDEEDEQPDAEEQEEGEDQIALTLILDILPIVDTKLTVTQLEQKMDDLSTSELFDAYVLNEAAVSCTAELIEEQNNKEKESDKDDMDNEEEKEGVGDDDTDDDYDFSSSSSIPKPLVSFQLREKAEQLRQQMEQKLFSPEIVDTIRQESDAPAVIKRNRQPQQRGQRIRAAESSIESSGGAVLGIKQTLQHNLNIVSSGRSDRPFGRPCVSSLLFPCLTILFFLLNPSPPFFNFYALPHFPTLFRCVFWRFSYNTNH